MIRRWSLLIRILVAAVIVVSLMGWVAWRDQQQKDQLDGALAALQLEQDALTAKGEETVAPSVEELLENPELRGPKGDTGRGIAPNGQKCIDGVWQVTYTDGAVDYNAGPCGPGEDGADGNTGAAGPSGPPGIDGQDGTNGLNGENGLDGADGKDGRGVAENGFKCEPPAVDGTWRWHVTYTDGTVDEDAGPCYWPGPLG